MLINAAPPPLPGFSFVADTAALCPPGIAGMSGDPFGITDVIGAAVSFINAQGQQKIAKKQIAVQKDALTQQKLVDAENYALQQQGYAAQQAMTLAATSEKERSDQMLALMGVGGVAVVVAGLFIYGAVKK